MSELKGDEDGAGKGKLSLWRLFIENVWLEMQCSWGRCIFIYKEAGVRLEHRVVASWSEAKKFVFMFFLVFQLVVAPPLLVSSHLFFTNLYTTQTKTCIGRDAFYTLSFLFHFLCTLISHSKWSLGWKE